MYISVQPDNYQSGNDQKPTAGQGQFGVQTGQTLPSVDPTNLGITPTLPTPTPMTQNAVSGSVAAIETWVQRVEVAITSQPNPNKRADAITKLKMEYQQNVLGFQPKPNEGQMP